MTVRSFADQNDALPVQISTDGGRVAVQVAGRDVTTMLCGFSLDMGSEDRLPLLTLEAAPQSVEFTGLAHVTVQKVESDPGPAAAVFLAAIDAEQLEQAALNRADLDCGPQGLTKAMLAQLQDWANGRS